MSLLVLLACKSPLIEVDYLAVTALSPPDEAQDVAVDPEITVTFNEALVPESVDDTTVSLFANDGTAIAMEVLYLEGANTVIATPEDPLAYDAAYTFLISPDVEGAETGPMPADVLTRFRTGLPGPGPSNLVPVADAGVDLVGVGAYTDVQLDGGASVDPEAQRLDFHWRLVARPLGSSSFVEVPDAASTVLRIDLPGRYVAGLVVNDGYNDSEEDLVTITAIESIE
jgi:hypothetical protein